MMDVIFIEIHFRLNNSTYVVCDNKSRQRVFTRVRPWAGQGEIYYRTAIVQSVSFLYRGKKPKVELEYKM